MFELYGWISVGELRISLDEAMSTLKNEAIKINFEPLKIDFMLRNEVTINISGVTNRDRGYVDGTKTLIHKINEVSSGSYGIVYYSVVTEDGEDVFEVIVIRKGIIEIKKDIWLSPRFPMIEDVVAD